MLLDRRQTLVALAAMAYAPLVGANGASREAKQSIPKGTLVIIGGAEDRQDGMLVLHKFVELCGPSPSIVVLTAASASPDESWNSCQAAFGQLGVPQIRWLGMTKPMDADKPEAVEAIRSASGVFMTGGDQRRLLSVLNGSATAQALRHALRVKGACIGGTSAGAAAMSKLMLADGSAPVLPEKGAARLDEGLGLLPCAIVDQHFSQRRRLGRLLSAVSQAPQLLGVGIDEDTALVIRLGRDIEVVGAGSVTLLDGRRMVSNAERARSHERLEMMGVRLHLLPAGNRYGIKMDGRPLGMPHSLKEVVTLLSEIDSGSKNDDQGLAAHA